MELIALNTIYDDKLVLLLSLINAINTRAYYHCTTPHWYRDLIMKQNLVEVWRRLVEISYIPDLFLAVAGCGWLNVTIL